jgi:hypothetical protein
MLFLSCAKPTDPESLAPSSGGYSIVGRLQLPGYAEDIEVKDTLAYIAQGEGGLAIVSIADRSKPKLLSVCQEGVRGTSHKLALNDSTVYVAANTFGVSAIDVRNPRAPVATSSNIAMKPAQSLYVFGSYLFAATGETGVQTADISTPMYPNPLGPFSWDWQYSMSTTCKVAVVLTRKSVGETHQGTQSLWQWRRTGQWHFWHVERREFRLLISPILPTSGLWGATRLVGMQKK